MFASCGRFCDAATARRMNLYSKRGSPSKYRIFSLRSRTSINVSRWLFCVTISPGRGETLKRNTRAPASDAVNRTRTGTGSPAAGSFTSCDPTIRPSSSTSSITVSPGKPVCVMTASTRIDVPFSADRGTETRPIWMSLLNCSWPTPTVNTGTSAALSASSASDSEASVVSAPSVTMTRPASGRPASSCRAPSSAAPSLVCDPANVSSAGVPIRRAADENRNVRTMNLSDSAFMTGDSAVK